MSVVKDDHHQIAWYLTALFGTKRYYHATIVSHMSFSAGVTYIITKNNNCVCCYHLMVNKDL